MLRVQKTVNNTVPDVQSPLKTPALPVGPQHIASPHLQSQELDGGHHTEEFSTPGSEVVHGHP